MGYRGLDLDGRTAVVIGGTSGIGRVLALGLAEAGADVVPTARRTEQVDRVATEIEALRRSQRVASDVLNRASIEQVLKSAIATFGKIDILVYSAGITVTGNVGEIRGAITSAPVEVCRRLWGLSSNATDCTGVHVLISPAGEFHN